MTQKNISTEADDAYLKDASRLENFLFSKRSLVIAVYIILTVFFGYHMAQMRPEASFLRMIPTYHPFIKNYLKYENELKDMGNVVRICVETTKGAIFSKEYLEKLRLVTEEVFYVPGVNRGRLQSLWTSNVRWSEITEEGFQGGVIIPNNFTGKPEELQQVQINIFKANLVGGMVANDFKSTIIVAPLNDIDPETRKPLDYHQFALKIEQIRTKFQNEDIKIHITGFAKIVGDLIEGSARIGLFFLIAFLILLFLLWFSSRCPKNTAVRAISSLTAVVWQLGIMRIFGYGMNPYSMLVPFLMFALVVSHGMQMFNAMGLEMIEGADKVKAARLGFRQIFRPGLAALFTDFIGFATLLVIQIGVIQDIAVGASIGVAVVAITNLLFLPVLMSYSGISDRTIERMRKANASTDHRVWKHLTKYTETKWAYATVVAAVIFLIGGLYFMKDLKIGDLDPGAPELMPDSRYNLDDAYLNSHYSTSSDVFVVMLETGPGGVASYPAAVLMDMLDAKLTHDVKGVQKVESLTDLVKGTNMGFTEGFPKFMVLPRNQRQLSYLPHIIKVNSDPMAYQREGAFSPIKIYLQDHKAETLEGVVKAVGEFAKKHNTDDIKFLMAAGNSGIEAAVNIEVEKALWKLTALVYAVVFFVCLLTYKDLKGAICVVTPLLLTSILCEALMAQMGIGIKVATLPVIAVGVGIGVDYGIYIYNKLLYYRNVKGHKLTPAFYRTLNTTGRAVSFTGITLSIGVATWAFSPIKFQADMGFLLTFMFLWNMAGAMVLLPAIARILWKKR